jgi:hypothetical protein
MVIKNAEISFVGMFLQRRLIPQDRMIITEAPDKGAYNTLFLRKLDSAEVKRAYSSRAGTILSKQGCSYYRSGKGRLDRCAEFPGVAPLDTQPAVYKGQKGGSS